MIQTARERKNNMNRDEHLEWAKDRALKENTASLMWISFVSDLGKHKELENHIAIALGNAQHMMMNTIPQVKKFIEDTN